MRREVVAWDGAWVDVVRAVAAQVAATVLQAAAPTDREVREAMAQVVRARGDLPTAINRTVHSVLNGPNEFVYQ